MAQSVLEQGPTLVVAICTRRHWCQI